MVEECEVDGVADRCGCVPAILVYWVWMWAAGVVKVCWEWEIKVRRGLVSVRLVIRLCEPDTRKGLRVMHSPSSPFSRA